MKNVIMVGNVESHKVFDAEVINKLIWSKSESANLNGHTELKKLFQSLGSMYKKSVIDFSKKYGIELNTTRKWFYIGMGTTNSWFCSQHNRFCSSYYIKNVSTECGLTMPYAELVRNTLDAFRIEIRKVIDSSNLEESYTTVPFNEINDDGDLDDFGAGGYSLDYLSEIFQHFSFTQMEPPLDYLSGLDFPNPNWK